MSILIRGRVECYVNVVDSSHHSHAQIAGDVPRTASVTDTSHHGQSEITFGEGQDPAFAGLPVSATWTELTPFANIDTPADVAAFSGGASAFGRIQISGGGHNNGMYDGKWELEWSDFSTVGWVRTVDSAADILAVDPNDTANDQISTYVNANYTGTARTGPTPGMYQRPAPVGDIRLSVHTYDGGVATATHTWQIGGENSYDNPGQLPAPWANRTGTISRRVWGAASEEFISNPLNEGEAGVVAATLNTTTGDIWFIDWTSPFIPELFTLNTTTFAVAQITTGLNPPVSSEGQVEFDEDTGAQGSIWVGGGVGSPNLQRYDIATNAMVGPLIAIPGDDRQTAWTYVPASVGANYGTLFAYDSALGELQRLDGAVWTTIATGGPVISQYFYERFGYDPGQNMFFAVYHDGIIWRHYFVRPYA